MSVKAVFLSCVLWALFAPTGRALNPGDTVHPVKQHNIATIYTEPSMAPGNQWQKQSWAVDTDLNNLESYTPQYNLGNTGTQYVPLVFTSSLNPIGFYYGNNYLGPQIYSDSNIRYFNTRAPYAQLYYVTDPKIHQFFHFVYAQNVGKKFNFAFEFQRTRSQGAYINQGTNVNQITLAMNYHIKRYALFANAMYGSYKLDQNGGIIDDANIGDANFSDRNTVAVNLHGARSAFLDKSVHIRQYLFFGYHSSDSSAKIPTIYLSHSLRVSSSSNIYTDQNRADTLFYPNRYINSDSTYDSVHINEITNDISIGAAKGWPAFLRWEAGITNQWAHFNNGHSDSIFSNNIVHASIYDTGRIIYNLQGRAVIAGNQKGDQQASACIGIHLDSLRSVRLQGEYGSQTPALVYELYYGDNFRWYNQFNRVNTSSASLIYTDAKWKLSLVLQASQITNLTYFTVDGTPQQDPVAINVLSVHIKKDFKLGKWHWNANEIFQYVPDSLPLRLPRFVLENSVFYENYLFHKHLLLRLGVDVYYNTGYYGYAFNPVTSQYFLQNQQMLGNYTYLDPFASFKIKTFRMFLKLENAGSKLIGNNYFYALHYPTTDRVLRLGISWDFWN